MKKILVAEDEDVIRDFVVINLERGGYQVTDVPNGEAAVEAFEREGGDFGVALLDIMMPGIDGFEVCRIIREKNPSIGIIMLSAKSQEMDKVRGLMLGADDYMTKPFSPSELLARVDALFRRVNMIGTGKDDSDKQVSGPFVMDNKSRTLTKNGTLIELTQVEYQIMEMFMTNPNTALERTEILGAIWGEGFFGDVKIIDVNIRRLRMKIEDDPSNPQYLVTVWGYGYKWNI